MPELELGRFKGVLAPHQAMGWPKDGARNDWIELLESDGSLNFILNLEKLSHYRDSRLFLSYLVPSLLELI